jgi:pimeloyl-ACP methyl ester carboxylesterase
MTVDTRKRDVQFADISWQGRDIRLEYQWVGQAESDYPVIVFLHEGLGSVGMWKDFPDWLCREHGFTGLVFSRYGYGRSTPRPAHERWQIDFMHEQAHQVMPAFLSSLGVQRPWLFGHSDGASIGLLYGSRFPNDVSGIIVAAPHIFIENITLDSIQKARESFLTTDLRGRLERYHADVDSAFWGWNDAWLEPAFRAWNIEDQLASISCPVLAIQGENDEYGTLEQIYGIRRKIPDAELLVLPRCGHSPHRDQPTELSKEVARFIKRSR